MRNLENTPDARQILATHGLTPSTIVVKATRMYRVMILCAGHRPMYGTKEYPTREAAQLASLDLAIRTAQDWERILASGV